VSSVRAALTIHERVTGFRYRLIDTAGSELAIVSYPVSNISVGDTVYVSGGRAVTVLDVYDDEHSQEGGVQATLVVDDG
jgi:hypothetical protein